MINFLCFLSFSCYFFVFVACFSDFITILCLFFHFLVLFLCFLDVFLFNFCQSDPSRSDMYQKKTPKNTPNESTVWPFPDYQ